MLWSDVTDEDLVTAMDLYEANIQLDNLNQVGMGNVQNDNIENMDEPNAPCYEEGEYTFS